MAQIDAKIKHSNGNVVQQSQQKISSNVVDELSDQMQQQQLIDLNDSDDKQQQTSSSNNNNNNDHGENQESLAQLFRLFAKFGDSKSTGDTITLSNSDKWFKQAKIIDPSNKTITTVDTGIYFKQVAKTKKALTFKEYNMFLEKLATVKKIDLDELKNKLQNSGPPATNRTTTAMTSGAIGRLTDHTKYTGSHKQRFDETGKGRGKAGREDCPSKTGYVSGFKASN